MTERAMEPWKTEWSVAKKSDRDAFAWYEEEDDADQRARTESASDIDNHYVVTKCEYFEDVKTEVRVFIAGNGEDIEDDD